MKHLSKINISRLFFLASVCAVNAVLTARAADPVSPVQTSALREFSSATQALYKQISAARIHVRLEQNISQFLPAEWRKDFDDWRAQAINGRGPDDLGPMNNDGPATVLIRPGGRGPRGARGGPPQGGAGPRGGGPQDEQFQQRQQDLMMLRRWIQERANGSDVDMAGRARLILQRLETLRANPSMEAAGFIYRSDGTALVLASLPLDTKNETANSITVQLPDNSEGTAKIIGSDFVRGLSIIKLDKAPGTAIALATEAPAVGDLLMYISSNTGSASWIITPAANGAGGRGPLAESRFAIPAEDPGPVFLFNISGELAAFGMERHALPISAIQGELRDLEQFRVVPRRQLGVKWGPITPEERRQYKLGARAAVRVDEVFVGSLASKMGMQKGDIVLSVGKLPVAPFMMPRIQAELATRTDPITITILRNDAEMDLNLPQEKK